MWLECGGSKEEKYVGIKYVVLILDGVSLDLGPRDGFSLCYVKEKCGWSQGEIRPVPGKSVAGLTGAFNAPGW